MWIIVGIWLTASLLTGYYVIWPWVYFNLSSSRSDSGDYVLGFVALIGGSLLCVFIVPVWAAIVLMRWLVEKETKRRYGN